RRVDSIHVADVAEVHFAGAALVHDGGDWPLVSAHQASVDAGQPHSAAAVLVNRRYHFGVDLPVEDHLRYFQRRLVGNTPAIDHLGREAEGFRKLVGLRSPTVNHHQANADHADEGEITRYRADVL